MSDNKHYNASYLESTAEIMKNIKMLSYQPLMSIEEGIVLDLGCGTGFDAFNIAAQRPDIHVIGIDHDAELINKAKEYTSLHQNLEFLQHEVMPLPYNDESIHGIRAERLFQHLDNNQDLLNEIKRVLVPAHPLVIVETDWSSLAFYNLSVSIEKKIRDYLLYQKVKNGNAAKELTSELARAGLGQIKLHILPLVTTSFEDTCKYIWIDKILLEMLEVDCLKQEEYDLALDQLQKAEKAGHFAASLNIILLNSYK